MRSTCARDAARREQQGESDRDERQWQQRPGDTIGKPDPGHGRQSYRLSCDSRRS